MAMDGNMSSAQYSDRKEKFEKLFLSYYPRVKNFIIKILNSHSEAEDITQDIFVKLWSHMDIVEDIRSLDNYIFRMAKNSVINHIKHKNIGREFLEKSVQQYHDMQETLNLRETSSVIDSIVEKMPPQRRRIFLMSREEGLSAVQIAEKLNISKRTVDCHIMLALTELKKILK